MYDRLKEIKKQHEELYKLDPNKPTLHSRDIDWLIEQVEIFEKHKVKENRN